MAQERVQKTKVTAKTKKTEDEEVQAKIDEEAQRLLDETDALFDAIDEALGENLNQAAEFCASFIQKGGE